MYALRKLRCWCVVLSSTVVVHAQLPDVPRGTISVEVQSVATGLSSPVDLVPVNDGSGRLFIVEQPGRIRILQNGTVLMTPFLDMADQVVAGGERGLLGLAFHPGFADSASPGFPSALHL
jgi:glucose/arabinose dehydrogenase